MGEQEEEAADSVPEAGHGQGLLVADTGTLGISQCSTSYSLLAHLDDLSDGVEHLARHTDGGEEVCLARRVNQLLPGVVPGVKERGGG